MNNIESYSVAKTVEYYKNLSSCGLFEYEKKLIEKYFVPGSRVIDIGCGAGRTSIALRNMGYDVVGVDYSANMIEAARALDSAIEYFVQDARNMTFPSDTFDCAFFSFNGLMLLESYDDRKKAALEIHRVLKNKGIFYFTTPFLDNKVGRGYWAEKVETYLKPLNEFSKDELLKLGDDVTEEDAVQFHLHIPFVNEIREMLDECGYDILFEGRRLDWFPEEKLEDELDDNYMWMVVSENVQL